MLRMKKLMAALLVLSLFTPMISFGEKVSATGREAAKADSYPVQEMNIVTKDHKYLQFDSITKVSVGKDNSSTNQRWQFIYVKENVFKLLNTYYNKVLTVSGAGIELQEDANLASQYFTIEVLENDVLGYGLTYKIASYENSSLVLTQQTDQSVTLGSYANAENQKWLLNSAGLQGFAGYSIDMDGNEKASTTGGVLGETVQVSTLEDLKKYAAGNTPTTIVITKDISVGIPEGFGHLDSDEKLLTKIVVGKNKTIIGNYGVSLNNIYFYLDKTDATGNFIIKNLTIKHSEELDLNNFIPMYISQGENFWIDHCTFEGHDSYSSENGTLQDIHQNGIDDGTHAVDKFMYVGVKADYVTVSDSKFTNHEYGIILGYPNENSEEIMDTYTGYPRMTMSGNYFTRIYCRAPGLMRYGYYHTFNNYVDDAHLAYTLYTRATVYSESNYYNSVKGILDDKTCAGFTDVGSYPVVNAPNSPATDWNPIRNYKYHAVNAQKAKEYCLSTSGAKSDAKEFRYVEDLFASYVEVVPTATPTVEPTVKPTETPTVAPTVKPTATPTVVPTAEPTETPTVAPTVVPTETPTVAPTVVPTETPTMAPTAEPTETPTVAPTVKPTVKPTQKPTPTIPPSLSRKTLQLELGTSYTLKVAGTVTNPVRWTSSNSKVASVENGTVRAIGVGAATITVKAGNYTATCIVTVLPSTVTNVKAKAQSLTSITLTWNKVRNIDGITVYCYNAKTKKYVVVDQIVKNKTSYTVKRTSTAKRDILKAGTTYQFRVAAYKLVNGKRVYSKPVNIATATAPKAPAVTKIMIINRNSMRVRWTKAAGATGYEVSYSLKRNSGYQKIQAKKVTTATFKPVPALKTNKRYYVKVRAYREVNGTRVYSKYSKVLSIRMK